MKKFLSLVACTAMFFAFTGCGEDDDNTDAGQPSLTWTANPTFSTTEITPTMSVVITANVPNGIKGVSIKVASPTQSFITALNAIISVEANKSATTPVLDLINDPTVVIALNLYGVPTGSNLKNKTSVTMDLSNMIPMVLGLNPEPNTTHIFTLTLTDNKGNVFTKDVSFHYASPIYE